MSVAVGLLVALAVLVVCGGRRRWLAGGADRRPGAAGARSPGRAERDVSAILLATSAQLRAGASPTDAWAYALGSPEPTVESLLAATARAGPPGRRRAERGRFRLRWRRADRRSDGARQRALAVVAAARLSDELGAPLAGVLERIASAVAADEEAEGERRAALAGPRATARVLAWLPLLGLVLGAVLGADPLGVVLSGGLGTTAAALGVGLLLVGRWWTAALLRRAARP